MASNHLNAGAASFTPGGPAPTAAAAAAAANYQQDDTETSYNEYADMVDSIEREMDGDAEGESYTAPPPAYTGTVSGLPAHMVKHANEFWFPESRDCTCCKGFKHGCECAASHGGICASCSTGPPPPSSSLQAAAAPPPQQHAYNSGGPPRGQPQQQQVCKFFRSGGCRFGDKCRFLHA